MVVKRFGSGEMQVPAINYKDVLGGGRPPNIAAISVA